MTNIYVASKTEHAPMWQGYRMDWGRQGITIVSTWIDEAGQGETEDFTDLWFRCISESASCDYLIAYHRPGEVWKGAFLEVGSALASGKIVFVVGDPPGTWMAHPQVQRVANVPQAIDLIIQAVGASNGRW